MYCMWQNNDGDDDDDIFSCHASFLALSRMDYIDENW